MNNTAEFLGFSRLLKAFKGFLRLFRIQLPLRLLRLAYLQSRSLEMQLWVLCEEEDAEDYERGSSTRSRG